MAKFRFELQDILEARKFEQTQAEQELGIALQKEREIQDKIDALAEQKVASKQLVKNSKDFSQIVSANNFSEFIKKQTEFLLEGMAKAKLETEQKREVLKKIMQKVNSLESLRDMQAEEFKTEQKKKSAKLIGGIVSAKYARENREKK